MLKGDNIKLRAMEPSDVDVLYQWENEPEIWKVSNTLTPYSKYVLTKYIDESHHDIYINKQLRLMICDNNDKVVGSVELFEFDAYHQRVGVGIVISASSDRNKGYASETLHIIKNYCFNTLGLTQVFCNITADNLPSVALFEKAGYKLCGTKKEWTRQGHEFKDELMYQLLADK